VLALKAHPLALFDHIGSAFHQGALSKKVFKRLKLKRFTEF
jgi:hypothetical protein